MFMNPSNSTSTPPGSAFFPGFKPCQKGDKHQKRSRQKQQEKIILFFVNIAFMYGVTFYPLIMGMTEPVKPKSIISNSRAFAYDRQAEKELPLSYSLFCPFCDKVTKHYILCLHSIFSHDIVYGRFPAA